MPRMGYVVFDLYPHAPNGVLMGDPFMRLLLVHAKARRREVGVLVDDALEAVLQERCADFNSTISCPSTTIAATSSISLRAFASSREA